MQYTIFVIISPFIAVTSGIIAVYAWQAKGVIGAKWLAWYSITAFWYLTLNLFELVLPGERETLLAAKLEYICITTLPVVWFIFSLEYSGKTHWVPGKVKWLLAIIPTATVTLVFTNEYHHLIWAETQFEAVGSRSQYLYLHVVHGELYYANLFYTYILLTISDLLIFYTYFRSKSTFKLQSVWIAIGAVLPLVPNLIYVFHLIPGLQKDFTVVSFALASIPLALGILRYQLFDLMPIARRLLIDHIEDGVLVLDQDERLADINPTAQRMLGLSENDMGKSLESGLDAYPDLCYAMLKSSSAHEISLKIEQEMRYYEVRVTPITKYVNKTVGKLVMLHDVTERVLLYQKIEEMASNDLLTGLKNRRAFIEQAENELQRANRYRHPISLMLIDIDYFKQVNDTFGHTMGDKVLKEFAAMLQSAMRSIDVMGRFAGDEFTILLPEISPENTLLAAQRLQQRLQNLVFHLSETDFTITVSIGIACLKAEDFLTFDTLFDRADKALYSAKKNGRNQITFYKEVPIDELPPDGIP